MVVTSSRAGYTLLELLVVLIIVGLILAIAQPLFLPTNSSTNIKAKAGELAMMLRLVRSEAISQNRPQAAALDLQGRLFWTAGQEPISLQQDLEVSLFQRRQSDRPHSREREATLSRILFFSNGSSSGGVISLTNGHDRYDIRVDWLTGKVSIGNRQRTKP